MMNDYVIYDQLLSLHARWNFCRRLWHSLLASHSTGFTKSIYYNIYCIHAHTICIHHICFHVFIYQKRILMREQRNKPECWVQRWLGALHIYTYLSNCVGIVEYRHVTITQHSVINAYLYIFFLLASKRKVHIIYIWVYISFTFDRT